MFYQSLPSYNEHIQLYGRHQSVLKESDLDNQFLESVRDDYHPGKNQPNKTGEGFLRLNEQDMHEQFETNYDEITGETRVKLGAYSYPIDITSCFTNAENCLQQTDVDMVDYERQESIMDLLCVHDTRDELNNSIGSVSPTSSTSPTRELIIPNISYTDHLNSDWSSQEQTICIDGSRRDLVEDKPVEPSFIQLVTRTPGQHGCNNSSMFNEIRNIKREHTFVEADSTTIPNANHKAEPDSNQLHNRQLNRSKLNSVFSDRDQRGATSPNKFVVLDDVRHASIASSLNVCPTPYASYETFKSFDNNMKVDMKADSPKQKENTVSTDLVYIDEIIHSASHEYEGNQTDKLSRGRGKRLDTAQQRSKTKQCITESKESIRNLWNDCDGTFLNRRKKLKRGCKLWEFIRNMLLNQDYNPSWIKWEDRNEGTFKLVQSKAIAHKWGMKKGNNDMTYEKLSRAMRYYYKKQVFQPVLGKRLIYKFGPRATGWRSDNDWC